MKTQHAFWNRKLCRITHIMPLKLFRHSIAGFSTALKALFFASFLVLIPVSSMGDDPSYVNFIKACGEGVSGAAFYDDDTIHSCARNKPSPSVKDEKARKVSSRRGAILAAQYEMIKFLKGLKIDGKIPTDKGNVIIDTNYPGVDKSVIIKEEYDGQQACFMLLELKFKGIKSALGR